MCREGAGQRRARLYVASGRGRQVGLWSPWALLSATVIVPPYEPQSPLEVLAP